MKDFSEKIKNRIVKECFDDICEGAQKEEAGALKGIVNQVNKSQVCFVEEKGIVAIEKNHKLSVSYIYKLLESKKRIQITQKIEEPFVFTINLNGEQLSLECDQYSCNLLN